MTNDHVPVTFGHLMCLLLRRAVDTWHDERGVVRSKMTLEECGAQCYLWAQEYPVFADDLRAQARQYGALMHRQTQGAPSLPTEAKAEAVPEMPTETHFAEETPYTPDLSVIDEPLDQIQEPATRERYAGEESPEEEERDTFLRAKQEIKRLLSLLGHYPTTLREADRVIARLTDCTLAESSYGEIIRKLTIANQEESNDVH